MFATHQLLQALGHEVLGIDLVPWMASATRALVDSGIDVMGYSAFIAWFLMDSHGR